MDALLLWQRSESLAFHLSRVETFLDHLSVETRVISLPRWKLEALLTGRRTKFTERGNPTLVRKVAPVGMCVRGSTNQVIDAVL